ncbi:hypothetical protein G4B88_004595 [Cannabis sativa]|uniref:Fe2OG dioxygenase domain-containing protein n=1 Tax=Cannabis sativa TaxID=3483 RepID=A0A7J6G567_CANSA|nr:hypothetical protein G4B88_004595 [Cannabis sativa]
MEFESCSVIATSVQELAKDPNMVTIPSKYIQNDQTNILNSHVFSSHEIPVINFQNLLCDSELTNLHLACKDWGFFQLINHGVSNSVVEKMKEEVEKLFKMPIEEKEKLWQRPGEVEGFGHTFLAKDIISQIEKVLGIENKEISKLFEDGMQSINMINYPPCPQPEKVIGVKPHSDTVALTILLQANQVQGLQVKKDGKWVLVKPLPNAFIVNILTNGLYPSIEHRVVVNPKQERLSIATFLNTNLDCDIGPASSLITQQNPPKYKTVTSKEYIKGVFSNEPDGKAYVDIMKLY